MWLSGRVPPVELGGHVFDPHFFFRGGVGVAVISEFPHEKYGI